MATIRPTVTTIQGYNANTASGQTPIDGYQVSWGPMGNGDVGLAVGSSYGGIPAPAGGYFAGYADKSIQVAGTFGAGGSVAVEGTNDGNIANFVPLTDPQGNPIALTAAGIRAITEAVVWVRPHVTAGDGTTSLTVSMFFRKTQSV